MTDPDNEMGPWAKGGSMSQDWEAGPPANFDVAPLAPGRSDAPSNRPGDAARSPIAGADDRENAAVGPPVRFGGRWLPVGIAIVFVATVGGIVFFQRGDDSGANDADAPRSSLSLPDNIELPTGADIGRVDAEERRAAEIAAADERERAEQAELNADLNVGGDFSNPPIAGALPTRVSVFEIAPELAGISPVEIVAIQPSVGVVEISIPSGRVRTTPVDFLTSRSELAVTDFGALVWPAATGAFELISTDGDRAIDTGSPVTWVSTTAQLDRFYVWPEPAAGPSQPPPRSLTASGEIGDGAPVGLDENGGVVIDVDPGGGFLQRDAGGTYRTDETGTRRLTTGDVVTTGRNHVLLRECDEERRCVLSALDSNGFKTLFSTDLPGDANPVQIGGLSPSGDALLMWGDRTGGVETLPELQVFELVDGARHTIHSSPVFEGSSAWATDSSGVFFADTRLFFFDRTSKESLVVSDDLPRLRALSSRQPAQSPTCELLTVALARFDDMRLVGDGSVPAPPIELLNKIIRFAPPDLATAAQPLVTFIDAFVSFEQPESQRVENWPENVRAGLTAFDEFAATEC